MAKDKDVKDRDTKTPVRRDIDENLKRVYDEVLSQEIPDRFKLLLEQLKAKEAGK